MFSEFVNKLSPYCKDQVMSNIIREWCKLADLTSPTRVFSVNRYLKSQTIPRNLLDQNDIESMFRKMLVMFRLINLRFLIM